MPSICAARGEYFFRGPIPLILITASFGFFVRSNKSGFSSKFLINFQTLKKAEKTILDVIRFWIWSSKRLIVLRYDRIAERGLFHHRSSIYEFKHVIAITSYCLAGNFLTVINNFFFKKNLAKISPVKTVSWLTLRQIRRHYSHIICFKNYIYWFWVSIAFTWVMPRDFEWTDYLSSRALTCMSHDMAFDTGFLE